MAQLVYDERLSPSICAVDFHDSSFFQSRDGQTGMLQLPTPSAVRAKNHGNDFGVVAYPEMGLMVKYGLEHKVAVHEAQTLQALRAAFPDNAVKCPELYGWRSEDDINYLYMSLIQGVTLESVWESLSTSEKMDIVDELRHITSCLRSLEPGPNTRIGSINGGRVPDLWFRGDKIAGPFETTKQFNDHIQYWSLHWLPMDQRPADPMRALLPDSAGIAFAHADLHLQNILVSGEPGGRQIAGLVDWGQAGWYPEYWEFCQAVLGTGHHEFYTDGWLVQVLLPYDDEYDAFVSYWQCKPG